jgi:hypothetical protein
MAGPAPAGRAWLIAITAAAAMASPAVAVEGSSYAAEPAGLWTGPMVSDTPATLEGAQVIDVPALEGLMAQKPLLIDVGPAERKPDKLSATAI